MNQKTIELQSLLVRNEGEYCELLWRDNGRVILLTSYGDWSYWWGSIGNRTLPEFLSQLNMDYMGGKLLEGDYYKSCTKTTAEHVKKQVLELRRHNHIDDVQARDEFNLAVELLDDGMSIDLWLHQTTLEDAWESIQTMPNSSWKNFWERVWVPAVLPELQLIVEAEKQVA